LRQDARVLVNPSVACGECRVCRRDGEHLCPNGVLLGRDADGGFAETIAVDERQLLELPDELDIRDASLLQVLGTCVHAQRLVRVFPTQTAAVIGLGVAGLLHVQLLRARGVARIAGITRSEHKRQLAAEMGATVVAHPDDAADAVAELTAGSGVDLAVEAAGRPETLAQAVELAGLAADVLVFGVIAAARADLPLYQLYYKELTIFNARAARHRDYAAAIDLAATGHVTLSPLLTGAFPLTDATAAFDAVADGASLKVILEIG
jgi:threonine dehydrogenase-like Zn-dependent dehydrogenase